MRGVLRKTEKLKRFLPVSDQQWAKFDLLRTLVRRDLEARYKGSVLGNLWPLVNQLSQLLIYTYVFAIVLKVKISLHGVPDNNFTFGLWLFAGLLPWISFTGGLTQASNSVIAQPNLVKKVVFPLALLPLVPVLSTFIESSFGLIALIFFVALATHTLHISLALLPLVWLTQLLLTSGLGYLTAGLTVFLRDIPQTLGVILNIWFYMTPIIYPASAIPENFRGWVFWLNPIVVFYVFMAILRALNLLTKHKRFLPYTFIVISLILYFIAPIPSDDIWSKGYLTMYVPFLLLGAMFYLFEKSQIGLDFLILFVGIVFCQYYNLIAIYQKDWLDSHFAILAFIIFCFFWGFRRYVTVTPCILFISNMTYAVYLFHNWFFDFVKERLTWINISLFSLDFQALVVLLLVCFLMTNIIEKPGIQCGRFVLKKLRLHN